TRPTDRSGRSTGSTGDRSTRSCTTAAGSAPGRSAPLDLEHRGADQTSREDVERAGADVGALALDCRDPGAPDRVRPERGVAESAVEASVPQELDRRLRLHDQRDEEVVAGLAPVGTQPSVAGGLDVTVGKQPGNACGHP